MVRLLERILKCAMDIGGKHRLTAVRENFVEMRWRKIRIKNKSKYFLKLVIFIYVDKNKL